MKKKNIDNLKNENCVDLSLINGGAEPGVTVGVDTTVNWEGWFDGSFWGNLFDGDKGTIPRMNEFDDTTAGVDVKIL